ncbi:MAG: hypothetical protein HY253_12680 [Burkholderiales bacterium]|nr:hypothetical protein [Burkholderiales bacterium]
MYPKEFFIEQFSKIPTEELLIKLSAQELTDNARDAVVDLLIGRGVSPQQIDALSREAHKALIRQSKGTSECDYCSNSARYKPTFDSGQRFCSKKCLHAARISEAAVDLTKTEIEQMAEKIRSGVCPVCNEISSPVEVRFHHTVTSFIVLTRYTKRSSVCCVNCGRKENWKAFVSTFLLGWWGFPWGVFMTPTYLIANLGEMFEGRKVGEPSEDLLREAKFRLAMSAQNKLKAFN